MLSYDAAHFDPPAPVAHVTLRNPHSGATVPDMLLLLDTGADLTLLPPDCSRVAWRPAAGWATVCIDGIRWEQELRTCCDARRPFPAACLSRPLSVDRGRAWHYGSGYSHPPELAVRWSAAAMGGPCAVVCGRGTAPNTCSEGGCQGFFTIFHDALARFWISEEPRRWSAWR
jgi:hypothetical protein